MTERVISNVAEIERGGFSLIRIGGRKFMCEKVLTIDSFDLCEDNRTVMVSCTLADGREVMLTFCPGEQITAHAL